MRETTDSLVFDWFQKSNAGECLVYYAGESLAKEMGQRQVGGIWAIRNLYDSGRVCLTQKKVGPRLYEYRATIRRTPDVVHEPHRFSDLPARRYK